MKKILISMTAILLAFSLTGCVQKNVKGTLGEIMIKVYTGLSKDELPKMLENMEVTKENVNSFLGLENMDGIEKALASEPGIGSIAHSVVLIRTTKDADIEKMKTDIKENVNPRKWICVGVEKEDVIVDSKGDLIILIMVDPKADAQKLHESFKNL
ncbi:MAG: hypothetical protein RSB77_04625 [Bacilli bacterium]